MDRATVDPDDRTPTRSALLVPVPEAEPVVGAHRRRLDQAAGWGVPAHVTVTFPFVLPADLSAEVIARVGETVATVDAFACTFESVGWFGEQVVWLAPAPAEPFRRLTAAVTAAFPDFPPYGGAHDDVTPHLTVGEHPEGGDLRAAAAAVAERLPVKTFVDRVWLMTGAPVADTWTVHTEFPLGGG